VRTSLIQLVRSFHLGGTEGQVVELLRGLPERYRVGVYVMSHRGPLSEEVAGLGYVPKEFPLKGSVLRLGTLVQVVRMAGWLREERAQLLHAHDFYGTVLGVPAAKLAGCKVVVGRLDLGHWHSRAQRAALALWTRLADHVVTNAAAIRRKLLDEEGVAAERVSVVRNGLDLRRFDEARRAPLLAPVPNTGDEPIVLHVANMNHPVKRQEDLLEAQGQLVRRGRSCQVFFVGDGPRRPQLQVLAERLGVAARAHFLGHRRDVPALYARATVGVLCSTHEGLSNAVIEGMAAGLPMVVTRVGGNPDLVEDGVRGRLVEPLQSELLADALEDLLGNADRARSMGAEARRFVERELGMARMVRAHEEVYERVLEGGSA
jgi:glycosyltransferase involved in cell wall biosynthesis